MNAGPVYFLLNEKEQETHKKKVMQKYGLTIRPATAEQMSHQQQRPCNAIFIVPTCLF